MAYYSGGDNNFGTAKWIVDPVAGHGTHTTIAAALTQASSGDLIFIRPGTYTENLTLKAGVFLAAYGAQGFGQVAISGKCTMTTAGIVGCSGIIFQTNGDFAVSITGSANSSIYFTDCSVVGTNNTAIQLNSSGTLAGMFFESCTFDLQTTGIAYYTMPDGNNIHFIGCFFNNSGGSTTASNNADGNALFEACSSFGAFSCTSAGSLGVFSCNVDTSSVNATTLTFGGSGANLVIASYVAGGTASAVSVSSSATVTNSTVQSSNTNVITGAGTIHTGYNVYTGSKVVNTTTKTYGPVTISNQVFTSNGTYTPTTGMKYCSVRIWGGGGGGGGAATSGAANTAIGGSGGAGEYAEGIFGFNTIGASQTVTIGAAGAAGTAGNNAGGTGGTTSLGALITAIGGTGGGGGAAATVVNSAGGAGGTGGTGGDVRSKGANGGPSFAIGTTGPIVGGNGGSSQLGSGAIGQLGAPGAGTAAANYGSGGSGGCTFNSAQQAGGAGTAGLIVITEYIFS